MEHTPSSKIETKPALWKIIFGNILVFTVTVMIGLGMAEVLIRVRNADQKNYNIEMWRYAKLLKYRSALKELGHEHLPNRCVKLQGVEIRTNHLGMRGAEPDLNGTSQKRVLVLGSSNTLGWGVPEEMTMCAQLQKDLGKHFQILNAGIGNYNASRYVALYEKRLREIRPDIVVVHYFIRDAEVIVSENKNVLLRNSELAVMLYHLWNNLNFCDQKPQKLLEHYRKMYEPGNPGLVEMEDAMKRLNDLSKTDHFKIVLAMVPDVHAIRPYPFQFIHDHMRQIASKYAWTFIDFAPLLQMVPQEDLWVMPGDPHINAKGQRMMAELLETFLMHLDNDLDVISAGQSIADSQPNSLVV